MILERQVGSLGQAILGVTALVWSSTKHHWLQQCHKSYDNFWLLPTLPAVHRHSSSAPFLISGCCLVLFTRVLCKLLIKHSWAQLPTKALGKWRWVSGSCSQKWGLTLYSSSVTQDSYFSAWAKTITPYQKARRTSPRSNFRPGLPFYAVLLHREEHHHMLES